MWLVDAFSLYLYGLRSLALALAVVIFISGLDDLFIDVVYWTRRLWRALTVYRRHERFDSATLNQEEEKPLAIMVPAWQEHGVIGHMAELAASTLDYENYHIFVGTYPNDPQTQLEVEQVQARFPNVHKVVCARPGPTSKADCLNNVLDAIFQFEQRAGLKFRGFILHDSEDVIAKTELRVFNHLVGRKDLIQVPVYPFPRKWYEFTGGHYLDEFAETHGKDVVVREALAGQIVLDIRHPDAQEDAPLELPGIDIQALPFYALNNRFKELDATRQYLLYCDKGVMSRLHAHHLLSEGHANVRVYRPA